MKLSIIMPVFNEFKTIETIIYQVLAVDIKPIKKELIIIDDGSTDGTREYLQSLNMPDTTIVFNKKNLGKAYSINISRQYITGEIVIIQDSDLEYNPTEYPKLLGPILSGDADVVYGSRFIGSEPHRVLYFWHSVGNRFLTMFSNMMTNLNLTDMETGYKMIRSSIFCLLEITSKGFGIEPEITAKLARLNCRIYEVGISYWGRVYQDGKKITWRDGAKALYYIVKYNFWRPSTQLLKQIELELESETPRI